MSAVFVINCSIGWFLLVTRVPSVLNRLFNQLYQSILSIKYQPPMFSPSAGLLLRDEIHHAFDRLELSFYFKVCHSSKQLRTNGDKC